MDSPIYKTTSRDAAIRFLEYLLDALRRGDVPGYESRLEPNGIGRHCVTTTDPDAIPFDMSDVDLTTTPADSPRAKARFDDPPEPKDDPVLEWGRSK